MNDELILESAPSADAADRERWLSDIARHGAAGAAAERKTPFAVKLNLPGAGQWAAVDRFAVRSLCWRLDNGRLRVAERATDLADASTPIDPQAIFDYLYFHVIPSPRTIFKGVHRIPPGHALSFENGQVAVNRYWQPRFEPTARPNLADLRAEFHTLLEGATRRCLDGSTPACFLSGGTDSSTVAGMIGKVAGRPAATYSIGFDAAGYDEMEYARIAARHFGTKHHEYYVTPDDLVRGIEHVAQSYDQPFGNSSSLPAYYCALRAREDGVTRLLAGDGGDELFGGNTRYAMQRIYGWYWKLPSPLRDHLLDPFFGMPWVQRTPLLRKGSGYIRYARMPMPGRMQVHNLVQRLGLPEVLTPDFLAQVDPTAVVRQQTDVWQEANAADPLDRELAFDWRYTLAENDLPKVRGTAALAGVDATFPLLVPELVDFSLRLPTEYKLRGLKLRWFFKEALRDFLPEQIIRKRKHGFGLPFGPWTVKHDGLRALAADAARGAAARGIVRADFVETLLSRHLQTHPGYYGEMLWILMMLECWLRKHAPGYAVR